MTPATEAFVREFGSEVVWGEVLVRRVAEDFELRHAQDGAGELQKVSVTELRGIAMHTVEGEFRPLKSAPNLKRGWRCLCHGAGEFALAMNHLYPGSLPDWHATRTGEPPVTHYRPFTERQSGMYRVTTFLTDEQAADVTRATCHKRFCLKRRLWTVEALGPDAEAEKSLIPCLEPCAILLEVARKAARIEQEPKCAVQLAGSEINSVAEAIAAVLETGERSGRSGDVSSPLNPRRLQLLLEKLRHQVESLNVTKGED